MLLSGADKGDNSINPPGGFKHFGLVKGEYLIVRGSIPGVPKRLIKMRHPLRNPQKKVVEPKIVEVVALKSKTILGIDGSESNTIELPEIFETPYRPEVMHKVYINLLSHKYQRQGRYPAAGEIVSAESRNTGLGIARLARARGEGFQRAGQAAGVSSIRHGRVAHPPESWKNIYKKINKKEKQLGICSGYCRLPVERI